MNITRIASVALLAASLAACQALQDSPKQTMGTLLGAGLGALAGSQIGGGEGQLVAVTIGALGGAWLGSELGKSMDQADRLQAERTAQQSLEQSPSGQTSAWSNPDSGNSGTFTPVNVYRSADGENCREYETTIVIDGREEIARGQACRQYDGTWKIVQ